MKNPYMQTCSVFLSKVLKSTLIWVKTFKSLKSIEVIIQINQIVLTQKTTTQYQTIRYHSATLAEESLHICHLYF